MSATVQVLPVFANGATGDLKVTVISDEFGDSLTGYVSAADVLIQAERALRGASGSAVCLSCAALLANAGHTRAIEVVEDLDSLTIGSVILDVDGDPWKKRQDGLWLGLRNELEESSTLFWGHAEMRPTVLHEVAL